MKDSMKIICASFLSLAMTVAHAQSNYGSNQAAAKYVENKGARIYYEVYGSGRPLLLLHGDLFGYIDEYAAYIPVLSRHFKVIAMATRGHGRSTLGTEAFSYPLMAEDAFKVLRQESFDSAVVIGFSGGGITGLNLAANHAGAVRQLVIMGSAMSTSDYRPEALAELQKTNADTLQKRYSGLIASRIKLMPDAARFPDLIEKLKAKWASGDFVLPGKVSDIQCQVLVIGGDSDEYFPIESFVATYRKLNRPRLAIVPGTTHVGLLQNPWILDRIILPFLNIQSGTNNITD